MNYPALKHAAEAIKGGGIVAYPTESVFGLGCDPLNHSAIERLLELKHRNADQGLILIAATPSQLEPFIEDIEPLRWQSVLRTWPGPATWLMPAKASINRILTGKHDTLAVRVTAHRIASDLCLACDSALVSTSANVSGQPPARDAREVKAYFGIRLDYILEGAVGSLGNPTEIRDALSGKVIRSS